MKRMAEILPRFLRAAIARWALAVVAFSLILVFSDRLKKSNLCGWWGTNCGKTQGWQWCRFVTELRRLGKNKFIELAASPLQMLAVGGAHPKHRR